MDKIRNIRARSDGLAPRPLLIGQAGPPGRLDFGPPVLGGDLIGNCWRHREAWKR